MKILLLFAGITILTGCQCVLAQVDSTLTKVKIRPIQYYPGETDSIGYSKPKPFRFVTGVPASFAESARLTCSKKSILPVSLIAASTLLLLPFDQDITNGVNRFSNYIHLSPDRKYETLWGFNLGSTKVKPYEIPQNINSVLYTLGEGSTSVFLTGGFFVYGKVKKDYRASQTASDIMQAQLAVGVITQLLKRVSGRESPFSSTAAGGGMATFYQSGCLSKTGIAL